MIENGSSQWLKVTGQKKPMVERGGPKAHSMFIGSSGCVRQLCYQNPEIQISLYPLLKCQCIFYEFMQLFSMHFEM